MPLKAGPLNPGAKCPFRIRVVCGTTNVWRQVASASRTTVLKSDNSNYVYVAKTIQSYFAHNLL